MKINNININDIENIMTLPLIAWSSDSAAISGAIEYRHRTRNNFFTTHDSIINRFAQKPTYYQCLSLTFLFFNNYKIIYTLPRA